MDVASAIFGSKLGNGSGGGGSAANYNSLSNKPKVNGTELIGNKSLHSLGIQAELTFDGTPTADSDNPVTSGGIKNALDLKVSKETGKGLSTNDFTGTDKNKLDGIESGAEVNSIISITVNGETLVPTDRVVALNILTETVNNLANYYKKTETYTQAEVNALIGSLTSLDMEIVEELPTSDISTTTIYLVQIGDTSAYTQYIYTNGAWAVLGNTTVDLSNYYTKAQVEELLAEKQDVLSWDAEPTALSMKPVYSGGIFTALAGKQNVLLWDTEPTALSEKSLRSGVIYAALAQKQDVLTFDETPEAGSTNPVTSDGIYNAINSLTVDTATLLKAGIVKPDGTSITIDPDGTIHGASTLEFDELDFTVDNDVVSLVPAQRVFRGTQAEWDALSLAAKKLYGSAEINDDSTTDVEAYSTEERYTGKVWIDGKPIYRIVLQITENISASGYTWGGLQSAITALNIDIPIQCFGVSSDNTFVGAITFSITRGFRSPANTGVDAPGFIILEYAKA